MYKQISMDFLHDDVSGHKRSVCKCTSDSCTDPVDFYDGLPVLKYIPQESNGAYRAGPFFNLCKKTDVRFLIPQKDDMEARRWWTYFLHYTCCFCDTSTFGCKCRRYFICPSPENPFSVFEQVVPNTEKVVLKGTFLLNTDSKENIFIWFTDSEKNCFVRRALRVEKEGPGTAVYVDKAFDKPVDSAGTCFIARTSKLVSRFCEDSNSYLFLKINIFPNM